LPSYERKLPRTVEEGPVVDLFQFDVWIECGDGYAGSLGLNSDYGPAPTGPSLYESAIERDYPSSAALAIDDICN
jgi:hypothetical protein